MRNPSPNSDYEDFADGSPAWRCLDSGDRGERLGMLWFGLCIAAVVVTIGWLCTR